MQQPELLEFFAQESLAVHAGLDRMGIPRVNDGELMSMSQRVELMAWAHEALRDANTIIGRLKETSR